MSLINKNTLNFLKRHSESYTGLLTRAFEACKTTDERLYAVNEYVGVLSDDDIVHTWHGNTLKSRIGFATKQISALPEPAVRKQGYKTVTGLLAYPDMFVSLGKKNALRTLDETLDTVMQDEDPTVRAAAFEDCVRVQTLAHYLKPGQKRYESPLQERLTRFLDTADQDEDPSVRLKSYSVLTKRLQSPAVHSLLPDAATDQITRRLQDTSRHEMSLVAEPTPAHTEFQQNLDRLMREPRVILGLHRANTQTISPAETAEPVDIVEAPTLKTPVI